MLSCRQTSTLTKLGLVALMGLSALPCLAENEGRTPAAAAQEAASPLPQQAPIKGFHPIKRALQPVQNLEAMSIKLEQQIMKLEGPISGLQPPMVALQSKMTLVEGSMGEMKGQLSDVQHQMSGVRADLAKMRQEIAELKSPILSIQKPLEGVSQPLEAVETQLNLVLGAIVMAAIAIAVGTPIAAILIYRFRDKLFPAKTAASLPREREKALR